MNSLNPSSSSLSPSFLLPSTSTSPPPIHYSRYYHYLRETTRHSNFVAVVLKFTVDPLLWIIQNVFYTIRDCFISRNNLFRTERASLNHMGAYVNVFNRQENHLGLFMNPNFCMLEENGEDWNQLYKGSKSLFERITTGLSEDHFKSVDLTPNGRLRNKLKDSHKNVLAMLINVNKRHWTVIHFNFQNSTISYVDSNGANVGNEKTRKLIDARLLQAHTWIQKIDSEKWVVNHNQETKSPSMLTHRIQYDFYDCGPWVMHTTYMISKAYSYEDICTELFKWSQLQVHARRLDMMNVVKDL